MNAPYWTHPQVSEAWIPERVLPDPVQPSGFKRPLRAGEARRIERALAVLEAVGMTRVRRPAFISEMTGIPLPCVQERLLHLHLERAA